MWATIFRDGHESLGAAVLHRGPGPATWHETPLRAAGNDRWTGSFRVDAPGRWEFTVQAWVDRFESFRDELRRKVEAGQTDLDSELQEGALLFGVEVLDVETALSSTGADRSETTRLVNDLGVDADRERARFGAWYELFPRSWGGFAGVEQALPELAKLGFDVVYLPPIHPIGVTNRKGRNNGPAAGAGRPRQPLGDRESGKVGTRRSIPALGTIDDFARLVAAARTHGLEIALDFAIQCSPDHPWLKRAPRVVPPAARRHAQVRGEPAEALPGHLQRQLRQPRLAGAVGGAPRRRPVLGRGGGACVPGRQPAHEAARVLGVADPGGARGRPRRHLPVGGLHAAVDDGRARQGGLQPVLHLLHLEEHEGGADRVHDRAHAVRAAAVLPAELLREHARHPPRVLAAWRPSSVRGATRARRDAVAELGDVLRLRARRERPGAGGKRGVPRLGEVRGQAPVAGRPAPAAGREAERDPAGERGVAAARGARLPRDRERPAARLPAPRRGQRPDRLREPRSRVGAGRCRGRTRLVRPAAGVQRFRAPRRGGVPLAPRPQLPPPRTRPIAHSSGGDR